MSDPTHTEPRETIRTVRLRYAYEDALRLADDLATAEMFTLSDRVREVAVAILKTESGEGEEGAALLCPLHSGRV